MVPDLRTNTKFPPPLPGWLKYVYFASVAAIAVSLGGLCLTVHRSRMAMELISTQQGEIAAARATVTEVSQMLVSHEASATLKKSLDAWRASAAQTTLLQAAVEAAFVEAQLSLGAAEKPKTSQASVFARSRAQANTPHETPRMFLKSLHMESHPENGATEIRLEIQHNCDSRMVVTAFSNKLAQYKPGGYQFDFRPDERPNTVSIVTTWRWQP